uniref:AlNc14C6G850 protein n=1 Tax=Albugo laibachii Nc14 TaxID=890382 RepID=F0W173_9STRA|nr:AlNc14C6G850 [Albugo laibachii Nc14]|eukprot:CCA14799.1 AlNc14C6G850 [Albugo laibachii Nc14]
MFYICIEDTVKAEWNEHLIIIRDHNLNVHNRILIREVSTQTNNRAMRQSGLPKQTLTVSLTYPPIFVIRSSDLTFTLTSEYHGRGVQRRANGKTCYSFGWSTSSNDHTTIIRSMKDPLFAAYALQGYEALYETLTS